MAVKLTSASDYLYTTSGLVAANSSKTVMCWAKQSVLPSGAAYNTAFESTNLTPATATQWAGMFEEFIAGVAYDSLDVNDGATHSQVNVASLAAGLWVHQCVTYNASTHNFVYYRNGAVASSGNFNINGNVWTYTVCGGDGFSHVGDYTVSQYREWDRVLTTFEIQTEMQAAQAVSSTNLWRDTPLASNLNDISGNVRNWTQAGSGSFVADPTYPSNGSIETATVISSLPSTFGFNFGDGFNAYYVYTPVFAYEMVLGAFAVTSTLADTVRLTTYGAGHAAWPASGSIVADNRAVQVPLLASTPVYLRIGVLATTTHDVALSLLPGPTDAVPLGSFAINDDTSGFPLALLDQTTALPLQFLNPFPAGPLE